MTLGREVNICSKCLNLICAKTSASLMCIGKQAVVEAEVVRRSPPDAVLIKSSQCEKHCCCFNSPIYQQDTAYD